VAKTDQRSLQILNWKAALLNEDQNETFLSLSDVIIPATETPGTKEAQVNRYLDLLLSVQPGEFQRRFVEALALIDGESQCCSIQSRSTTLCP
jgi:hypothetical protein